MVDLVQASPAYMVQNKIYQQQAFILSLSYLGVRAGYG